MNVVILGKGLMLANLVLGAVSAGANVVGVFRYDFTVKNHMGLLLKDFFNPDYEVTLLKQLKLRQLRFNSANSKEFRQFLISNNVDLVIVGTWREALRKETFNIPTIGTVNVHPSLLPKYRGPNPYIQAILNGETVSGVTLHLIDEGLDTGAILYQEEVDILKSDTSKELREKSAYVARNLVGKLISELNANMVTPVPQVHHKATYFSNITGEEKMLNFSKQSSTQIYRTIKALHPFLQTYITYKDRFFVVDPYSVEILPDEFIYAKAGDIIYKNPEKCLLTIVCNDNKAVQLSNLRLYKAKRQTKKYIEKFVKITS